MLCDEVQRCLCHIPWARSPRDPKWPRGGGEALQKTKAVSQPVACCFCPGSSLAQWYNQNNVRGREKEKARRKTGRVSRLDLNYSSGHTFSSETATENQCTSVEIPSPGMLQTYTQVSQHVRLHTRTLLLCQRCHPALWIVL